MWWRVPPASGVVGAGWLMPLGGPFNASECRWHISRWPGGYGTCCCANAVTVGCGHVTCSVFVGDASCALGAGVGVKGGASRCCEFDKLLYTDYHRLAVPDKYQRVLPVCSKRVGKLNLITPNKPKKVSESKFGRNETSKRYN